MRAYEIIAGSTSLDGLKRGTRPDPVAMPKQILVRLQAASLNFRDLMIARGLYFGGPLATTTIPLSDGTGEVTAVGPGVTRFKVGDRVCGTFFRGWIDGRAPAGPGAALGAPPADGVLADYAVFDEQDAVATPSHLSHEAAATLPCAGVTAWHALVENGRVAPGETVLIIGTGGVSIFALQFARLAGARVIALSSSDAKLERARKLGADAGINYRTTPEWEAEVLRLTQGRGVDHVIEVGGAGTLGRSIAAAAVGGRIHLIGVLTGRGDEPPSPYGLLGKQASIQGVFVGSRGHFERMNAAIASARLEPVIDRVFGFDEAPAAYRHLEQAAHVGKIVIRL
jgi:NADPH:quinone reductase-like Zn-dependent oxidoreductase